jgi:hypothetical protein
MPNGVRAMTAPAYVYRFVPQQPSAAKVRGELR